MLCARYFAHRSSVTISPLPGPRYCLHLSPKKEGIQELDNCGCGHTTEFEPEIVLFDPKQVFPRLILILYQNVRQCKVNSGNYSRQGLGRLGFTPGSVTNQ